MNIHPPAKSVVLIAHNLRSCHNVGSLLRTAEGLGVDSVYLTGYTPYPLTTHDTRMPHIANKLAKQINKTALGAEEMVRWQYVESIDEQIAKLKEQGYTIAAVEQATDSISLPVFTPPNKIALLMGREVEGVEPEVLAQCNVALEIPMFGRKESYNVVQAAAMAMYHCRFAPES
jgi:23S rRNA (guanosine2251-2'-O)-methyltransferase